MLRAASLKFEEEIVWNCCGTQPLDDNS
eukprot:SAG11_NODE_25616_length_356_cov_0.996109_1_plen_27_part_10